MFILLKNALVAPFSRTSDPVYNRLSSSEKPDSIADDIDLEARSHSSSSDEFTDAPVRKSQRVDPRVVSDAIIGLSDGLTVPFALTAGLSTLGDTKVVVYGGVAELVAGAISMGLGGYLGAKSEQYVPNDPRWKAPKHETNCQNTENHTTRSCEARRI